MATVRFLWIVSFALTALSFGADATLESKGSICVRLYVYAPVSQGTVARAKAAASSVLERAGVHLAWAEYRLPLEDTPKEGLCALPATPMDLQLRIVNADVAKKLGARPHRLGYAWLSDGLDSIAAAYYHRAVDLEKGNLADRAAILGYIMAHEIGHLLLDSPSHSRDGVMRALWDDSELKSIAKGRLSFTPEQARMLTSMAAKRRQVSAGH